LKLSKHSLHQAAVLFVAAEATRRGYPIYFKVRGVDMTIAGWAVQVCATQEADDPYWMVSDRHERERRPDLMFVFVRFSGTDAPKYHVVPGAETVRQMEAGHARWQAGVGRHGRRRNYSPVRLWRDLNNEYLNGWERFAAAPRGTADAAKRKRAADAASGRPGRRRGGAVAAGRRRLSARQARSVIVTGRPK
jgi:hypothetical protein